MASVIFIPILIISYYVHAISGLPFLGNSYRNDNCPIFGSENITHEAVPLSVVACAMAEFMSDIPMIEKCFSTFFPTSPFIGSDLDNLEDFLCYNDIADVDTKVRECAGKTAGFFKSKPRWFFDPLYKLWENFSLDTECQMKVYAKMVARMDAQVGSSKNREILHKHFYSAARTYYDPYTYPEKDNREYFEKSWLG